MGKNIVINNNCWVACCDTLGFEKKLSDFEKGSGCGRLDIFVQNFYSKLLEEQQNKGNFWPDKVFTAWASDTFLFFTHDDSEDSFGCIATTTKCFCWRVMGKSWPLRGAIGFGQFYADESNHIFLGSGLIDAYKYAEKQNWIGIIVTPKANSRLRELNVELKKRPVMFREYDVPVKRKEIKKSSKKPLKNAILALITQFCIFFGISYKNGICTIVEETECLFAMRIHSLSNVRRYVKQMQRAAMNDKDYEVKYKAKYENTFKFFEETK